MSTQALRALNKYRRVKPAFVTISDKELMTQGMTAMIGSPFVCMCNLQNSLDILRKSVELSSQLEDSSDDADVLGIIAISYTDRERLGRGVWEVVSGVQRILLCMLQKGNLQNSQNVLHKSLGLPSDLEDISGDADIVGASGSPLHRLETPRKYIWATPAGCDD